MTFEEVGVNCKPARSGTCMIVNLHEVEVGTLLQQYLPWKKS